MLYDIAITQFSKMLQNLSAILDKAQACADAKKFDSEVLVNARLAPDMFALMKQIQIACDTAKNGAAKLTEKDAPVFEDNEKTLADAKARIERTLAYLASYKADDFAGALERRVTQPRWAGKTLSGQEFALQHMMPNFYFHITTAYAILRSNGVEVGKKDYLGPMPYRESQG